MRRMTWRALSGRPYAAAEEELGSDPAVVGGFTADAISLWRTDILDLTCQSWQRVQRFPLQAPPPE